jgi:protease I
VDRCAVDRAHTDGHLVTAPAWPAHPEWLRQFMAVLGTRIEHEETASISA